MATGSADSSFDLGSNADAAAYGTANVENVAYYRITARSSAPGDAVDRAIVVLQSTVKRSF